MKETPFDIVIGERRLRLTSDNLMVLLFRIEVYQDLDHMQIYNEEEGSTLDVWRNTDLCRWVAGIAFDGARVTVPKDTNRDTFNDLYGWNPRTLIRERPEQGEIDDWISVELDKDLHEDGSFDLGEE